MTYESCPPIDTVKPKLSFVKDTLKVKVSKDNQLEDEMNRSQQTMIHEICPPRECEKERLLVSERPSVMEKGRSSQVEDLKKFSNDVPTVQDQNNKAERHEEDTIIHDNSLPVGSGKERLSLSESTSVLENGLPSQILEDPKKLVKDDHQDGKKFVQDEGCMEGRNLDMSKYTDERDRQEGGAGGEWEAAKHFNQLFCGVKNKIASFMAWQTDTEKKEDLMDTDACRRSQLQSEGGPDLVDIEHAEMKTKLTNQVHAGCPGEHVEMEIGFLSEIVDPCEDESVWSNTAGPEKAESSVSLNPVVASSSPESLIFFPFRNEEIHDLMDTNVEQNIGSEESSGIEFMNVREEVLSEMKYEQLQDKCEENNHKALDDACITQNREVLDDDFMNQNPEALDDSCTTQNHEALDDSNIEEINKIVEEPCLLAGKERNESTEEDPKRSLNEESGDDPMHDSHYSESTTERIDENGNCGEDPKRNLDEECREDPLHDSHFPEITTESTDEEYDETKESEKGQHDAQILEETDLEGDLRTGIQATEETHECQEIARDQSQTSHIEEAAGQMHGCNEFMTDDTLDDRSEELEVTEKESFSSEDACMKSESSCIEVITEEITEEASFVTEVVDELTETKNEPIEDTAEQVACFGTVDDDSQKAEDVCLSESEGPFTNDHGSGRVEEVVSSDDKHDSTMEILKSASEAKLKKEETVEFYDSFVELDGITEDEDDEDDDDETLQVENLHSSQSDVYPGKGEIDANVMETESRDILENQTEHVQDSEESLDMGVTNTISGQEVEKCGVDAVQKRRRWFDNGVKVGLAERPSILEGDITEVETDQEALDESILAGSVEIHSDELGSGRQGVNQESVSVNSESTPKRRRWSVKIGEEGLPVPPPLFQGINVEEPQNIVNETLPHSKSESSLGKLNAKSGETLNATEADVSVNWQKDKSSVEVAPRRKRWFASDDNVGPISQPRSSDDAIDQDFEVMGDRENQKCENSSIAEETEVESCKMEEVNDRHVDEMNRKEKERMVVERAIREARERAFAEARDRARRDTSERPNVEVRQKVGAGAQERVGKVPAEARGPSDKASMDAKLRAERAAVERATSEARERALQKALSEKGSHRSREQKNTSSDPNFQSSSSFSRADLSNKGEKYDGFDSESAQRRKTRTERQSRTTEQAATALEEKNRRDLLVQKEQAAKNMMADSLDAELKRWSAGKEGNLRLLLSTLQYILGPESGWQAVSLTDLMAATAVRKAYKKATLCVHPDKLQQRGATIQQKYICERVFDLLKDAWSKLNPNER
ncbi:uncharacterized protein LOC141611550 [Silene latifolia]|uniref:uncharacterized protein LOC141611550 n=1 Tax=Silene latifolia TaxID=37657 RepID=UPI003D784FA8